MSDCTIFIFFQFGLTPELGANKWLNLRGEKVFATSTNSVEKMHQIMMNKENNMQKDLVQTPTTNSVEKMHQVMKN